MISTSSPTSLNKILISRELEIKEDQTNLEEAIANYLI
jgi:hypothetical protein